VEDDLVFDFITIFSVLLFLFEIIAACVVTKGYYKSFFMSLDIVSTLSLIMDIGFIFNPIFAANGGDAKTFTQGAKAGRIGTK